MKPDEVAVAAEWHDLRDFLEDVDDVEWATPSLGSAWNVREVVAHLTLPTKALIGAARYVSMSPFRS